MEQRGVPSGASFAQTLHGWFYLLTCHSAAQRSWILGTAPACRRTGQCLSSPSCRTPGQTGERKHRWFYSQLDPDVFRSQLQGCKSPRHVHSTQVRGGTSSRGTQWCPSPEHRDLQDTSPAQASPGQPPGSQTLLKVGLWAEVPATRSLLCLPSQRRKQEFPGQASSVAETLCNCQQPEGVFGENRRGSSRTGNRGRSESTEREFSAARWTPLAPLKVL